MFGDFLKFLLKRHGVGINQFSRMTGGKVLPSDISRCVNRHLGHQNPTLQKLDFYAEAFGLKTSQFLRAYERWKKDEEIRKKREEKEKRREG